jgi:hypothetical protein
MKVILKKVLATLGIRENSIILKPYIRFASAVRNLRIPEKLGDKFGIFASHMVSESDLKSYWKLLQPHSNGHELVRVGGKNDGGYLLPNDFEGIKYCYSPGAGTIWTFEESLGTNYGIESMVCDGTIEMFPSFDHLKSFIPKNVGLAESENIISIESWVGEVGASPGDLILQMDIEGGEYPILSSIDSEFLLKFRIIVLELHDLHLLTLLSSFSYQYSQLMFNLLKNFDVVHLHPNNCGGSYIAHGTIFPKVVEITLHRKDRAQNRSSARIPHILDAPNNENLGEFPDYGFAEWLNK